MLKLVLMKQVFLGVMTSYKFVYNRREREIGEERERER